MSRAVLGLWVFLAVLSNAVACHGVLAADDVVDNREASFLPPPESLLKVEPAASDTAETTSDAASVSSTLAKTATPSSTSTATPVPAAPTVEKPKPLPAAAALALPPPTADAKPIPVPAALAAKMPVPVAKAADPAVVPPVSATPQPQSPAEESIVQKAKEEGSEATSALTPVAPSPSAQTPAAAPATLEPVALGGAVAQTKLADIDPETLGLLSESNGGLGTTVWKDTGRVVVDRFMPALALPVGSATLNDLARRLFLSTAAAPQVASGEKPARSLLSERIEALMALGAVKDAWKLASLADPKLVDEVTLRQLTEAALIGPDSKEVCDKVPALIKAHATSDETGREWQKSLLVCQLRAGDTKAVQLSVDLMREQNARDAVFLSLVNKNVLAQSDRLPRQLTPLRPLNLAVLRQIAQPLPPELYARAEALMIPELLKTKATEEDARILLAERAAAKGIITAPQLADVYKDVAFKPEEVAAAMTQQGGTPSSRTMAFQALVNEQSPAKKIELVQKVTDGLSPVALIGAEGSLLTSYLESIPVVADHNAFSAALARLFALAGKPDKAMAWLHLARTSGAQSEQVRAQLLDQWPLFVLSGLISDGEYAQGLKDWLDKALANKDKDDGNEVHAQRELCGNILLLLDASGYAVNEEAWQRVLEPKAPTRQYMPSPVLADRMMQASLAGRKGEMILLGLVLEGSGAEDMPTPFGVQIQILRALRQAGLTAESQAYAREILVGLTPKT